MKTRRVPWASFMMLAHLALAVMGQEATVVTYSAPLGADKADDFAVKVSGEEIFVYDSQVAAFAYFSFGGKVTVSVMPDHARQGR
jgi:hypothetical protein